MKTASITEAKNSLSALIDSVKAGGSVLITDRGRPVARLEPVVAGADADEARLARLIRAGVVRPGRTPLPPDFFTRELPKPKGGASVVEALLEERREGR
jgi:prevent-host-death family protein